MINFLFSFFIHFFLPEKEAKKCNNLSIRNIALRQSQLTLNLLTAVSVLSAGEENAGLPPLFLKKNEAIK